MSEDVSKEASKANRAINLKLARTAKASHYTALRRSQIKTPTRLSKVRPRGLLTIERGKKSIWIQGILAHGSAERIVEGDNSNSYDELELESEYENDKTNA